MKSKLIDEFKQFAMRGNVIDLAVGVVIGAAFGKIVSSLVADVIMPPIGVLVGGVNFTDLGITLKQAQTAASGEVIPAVTINYGNFLQATFDFIIIAFAIFLFIKLIKQTQPKKRDRNARDSAGSTRRRTTVDRNPRLAEKTGDPAIKILLQLITQG